MHLHWYGSISIFFGATARGSSSAFGDLCGSAGSAPSLFEDRAMAGVPVCLADAASSGQLSFGKELMAGLEGTVVRTISGVYDDEGGHDAIAIKIVVKSAISFSFQRRLTELILRLQLLLA